MEVGLTLYRDIRLRHCALELRADMTNLLDKQYEIIARYPMPGRAWALSVAIRH
jgi:outer membrane cobalamin receptor